MKTTLTAPIGRKAPQDYASEAVAPTPQPWAITTCKLTGAIWIERKTGGTKEAVCKMGPNFHEGRDLANAELILSALNSREHLVRALESSLNVFRGWLHDVDPYNELGNDNPDRAAAVIMIECCRDALAASRP